MTFVDFLGILLPILLYVAGIFLLIVLIIIGIRIIRTMNKVDTIVADVDKKVKSLNGLFSFIDNTTDKLSFLTDKVVDSLSGFLMNMFSKKNKKKKEEEETNEEG
jgi:hypothetical protein